MKRTGFILLWLILVAFPFRGNGAHLVGGEMSYRCLGNNQYEVTLIIYRDCLSSGASFDSNVFLSVYDQYNNLVSNDSVPLLRITTLPLIAPNNCTTLPQTVCTEKGLYIHTLTLPPILGGYTLTHQRCCRNNTITNINNTSSQWGSTYTTSIPSMDTQCNSSPKFLDDPPVVLCQNINVQLDLSANDNDGDSLHYELCSVLNGGANSPGMIVPTPAAPPPYVAIPFLSGYTVQQPISSFPAFSIDPITGMLTGTPNQIGQFVFAICVSEYRNGALLSTTRRDFQFNVSNACRTILARIQDQNINPLNICSGGLIQFKNQSQFASGYLWDFGDPASTTDTSRSPNPSYLYPDTGTYIVTLIADPRTGCADTAISIFRVFDSTTIAYTYQGELCFEQNNINFTASGNYSSSASFIWDFGGNTSLGTTSTLESPQNVSWTQPGTYYVTVSVNENGCDHSYSDSIHIFIQPEIDELVIPSSGCAPYTVSFQDQSTAMGPVAHWWSFGDGNFSTATNPSHKYTTPGIYTIQHSIRTLKGCIDSGYSSYTSAIEVFPVPTSGLLWDTKIKSIYDPVFSFSNASENSTNTETILPNGQEITNLIEASFSLSDTGNFEVFHISYNEFGCVDTLIDTIRVDDPFTLFIPSAFSPNGDEVNDLFTFRMSGISSMYIEVYNRWGEVVYSSGNPYQGWNGSHQNIGKVLPPGVYAYVFIGTIKKGGKELIRPGHVTLLR